MLSRPSISTLFPYTTLFRSWLDSTETEPFDIAIVDFPDPNNFALGKLYTTRFYNLLKSKLKLDSSVVIQTTSPLVARQSLDRKSTRLNSSHLGISYAVFCLK